MNHANEKNAIIDQIVTLMEKLKTFEQPGDIESPTEVLMLIGQHDHPLNEKGEIVSHNNCRSVFLLGGRDLGIVNGLLYGCKRSPVLEPIILDVANTLVAERAETGFDKPLDQPFKIALLKEITDRLTILANDFIRYGDNSKGPDVDYLLVASAHDHPGDDYLNDHKNCHSMMAHMGTHDGLAGLLLGLATREKPIADIIIETGGILAYHAGRTVAE